MLAPLAMGKFVCVYRALVRPGGRGLLFQGGRPPLSTVMNHHGASGAIAVTAPSAAVPPVKLAKLRPGEPAVSCGFELRLGLRSAGDIRAARLRGGEH
jgi:hypothetical protein